MFTVVCMFVFEMSSSSNTFCPLLDLESSSALSVEVPVDIKVKYVNWFKSGGMREIKKRSKKKSRSDSLIEKWKRDLEGESTQEKYRSTKDFMSLQFQEAWQVCLDNSPEILGNHESSLIRSSSFQSFEETFLTDFKKEYEISSRKKPSRLSQNDLQMLLPTSITKSASFLMSSKPFLKTTSFWVMSLILIKVHTTMQCSKTVPFLKQVKKLLKLLLNPWIRWLTPTLFKKQLQQMAQSPVLYICLQESTGMSFGPVITPKLVSLQSSMQEILISCSSSKIFHTSHHQQYFENIFLWFPKDEKVFLLIDSRSGQSGPPAQAIHASLRIRTSESHVEQFKSNT